MPKCRKKYRHKNACKMHTTTRPFPTHFSCAPALQCMIIDIFQHVGPYGTRFGCDAAVRTVTPPYRTRPAPRIRMYRCTPARMSAYVRSRARISNAHAVDAREGATRKLYVGSRCSRCGRSRTNTHNVSSAPGAPDRAWRRGRDGAP
eukprot:COSAG02_NODE_1472_length_12451_cov_183.797037_4_plen_147_part_00